MASVCPAATRSPIATLTEVTVPATSNVASTSLVRETVPLSSSRSSIEPLAAVAMLLLTTFVLYYFVNWKYLSEVWGLS